MSPNLPASLAGVKGNPRHSASIVTSRASAFFISRSKSPAGRWAGEPTRTATHRTPTGRVQSYSVTGAGSASALTTGRLPWPGL